jgi:hypothetical protein
MKIHCEIRSVLFRKNGRSDLSERDEIIAYIIADIIAYIIADIIAFPHGHAKAMGKHKILQRSFQSPQQR